MAMLWDWWKLLIPVIFLWKRTSDSGNCILTEVKENWCPTTVIRTNLDQRDYAPTFPVCHGYLTNKQSQLTYCRSNASQPDWATPVLKLNLVDYTFGIRTCRWIIKKSNWIWGKQLFFPQGDPMIWSQFNRKCNNWKNQPINLTATSTA